MHGYVQIEGNFYSVPARLLRQTVVRWDARQVRIIVDETVVAEHRREHGKAKIVTQEGHLPQAMTGGDSSFVRYYLHRAAGIGTCCHALVERLLTGPNAGNPLADTRSKGQGPLGIPPRVRFRAVKTKKSIGHLLMYTKRLVYSIPCSESR